MKKIPFLLIIGISALLKYDNKVTCQELMSEESLETSKKSLETSENSLETNFEMTTDTQPILPTSEDIERLFGDKEFALRILKCVAHESHCDDTGKTMKYWGLKLVFGCEECDEEQKEKLASVKEKIQTELPKESWDMLVSIMNSAKLKKEDSPMLPDVEDIDSLLSDKEAVDRVFKCLLDKGPCDAMGKILQYWAPKFIFGCEECGLEEKENFAAIKEKIQINFPQQWNELLRKLGTVEPKTEVPPAFPLIQDMFHLLSNRSSADEIFKCILDQMPCDDLGNILKYWAPKLILGCEECTRDENNKLSSFKNIFEQTFPLRWRDLKNKFNPTEESFPYEVNEPELPSFEDIALQIANDTAAQLIFNCLLDEGPCNQLSTLLKEYVSPLVSTICTECDDEEQDFIDKIQQHLRQNYPEKWEQLVKKYSPEKLTKKVHKRIRVSNASNFLLPSLSLLASVFIACLS